jgi:hypothetical protein
MPPVCVAIGHGCRAGQHQDALDELYWKRIRRGHQSCALTVLGAYAEDLGALTEFFDSPWSQPAAGLPEEAQENVPRGAAYHLGALGYVREAMAPFQAALARYAPSNSNLASVTASVLSQYAVLLGDFAAARLRSSAAPRQTGRGGAILS